MSMYACTCVPVYMCARGVVDLLSQGRFRLRRVGTLFLGHKIAKPSGRDIRLLAANWAAV